MGSAAANWLPMGAVLGAVCLALAIRRKGFALHAPIGLLNTMAEHAGHAFLMVTVFLGAGTWLVGISKPSEPGGEGWFWAAVAFFVLGFGLLVTISVVLVQQRVKTDAFDRLLADAILSIPNVGMQELSQWERWITQLVTEALGPSEGALIAGRIAGNPADNPLAPAPLEWLPWRLERGRDALRELAIRRQALKVSFGFEPSKFRGARWLR